MGFTLEECVENGKPTWVDLSRGGRSALRMVRESRELVERLSNRIGYHFHPQRATFPRRVESRGFDLELTWTNQGVAPIYIPCAVAVALMDESGKRAATAWPHEFRPGQWMPGKTVVEKGRIAFPGTATGKYRLALALTRKADDATPHMRLGTELPTVEGWSVLDKIEVSR